MDLIKILKTLKVSQQLYNNILTTEEKTLVHVQRMHCISSDSTEDAQSDYDGLIK